MRRAPKQVAIYIVADESGVVDIVRERSVAMATAKQWATAEPMDAPAKVYRIVFKMDENRPIRTFDPGKMPRARSPRSPKANRKRRVRAR